MLKKYAFILVTISVLLAQLCTITSSRADSPQEVPGEVNTKLIDGLHIMTKVGERNRGEDYIATVAWTLIKKGRVQQRAKYTEKRKNYGGKDGFSFKSVIRYSEPPKIYKKALLTWTYTNGIGITGISWPVSVMHREPLASSVSKRKPKWISPLKTMLIYPRKQKITDS